MSTQTIPRPATFTQDQKLTRATVNRLLRELSEIVQTAKRDKTLPADYPRDFIPNETWRNGLEDLIEAEAADERKHRRFAPDGYRHTYATIDAARLMVVHHIAEGARRDAMPTALETMTLRAPAVHAWVLGFILRELLPAEAWIDAGLRLDYARTVNPDLWRQERERAAS